MDEERIIPRASQPTLLQGPLGAILVLASALTGGQLSVVEHPLAPRALGSPLHTHQHEDEYSIVLEGIVGVQIGEDMREAETGSVVVKPRSVPHAFWNRPTARRGCWTSFRRAASSRTSVSLARC